jgi:hypothetical protein
MTFAFDTRWGHRTVALQAVASDPCAHHELNSDTFEFCSFDALSKTIRRDMSDMHMSDAFVACITPTFNAVEGVTLDNSVLSGKGDDHHGVCGVLEQYSDVPEGFHLSGVTRTETQSSTPSRTTPTLSR